MIGWAALALETTDVRRMLLFWLLFAAVELIAVLAFAFWAETRPRHKISAWSVRSHSNALLWAAWPCAAAAVAVVFFVLVLGKTPGAASQLWTWLQIVFTILVVVFLLTAWIVRPRLRADVKFALYGVARPKATDAPAVSFAEYEAQSRTYAAEDERVNAARAKRYRRARIFVPTAAAILSAVVLVSVLVPAFAAIRLSSAARSVRPGDTRDDVTALLGEPYGGQTSDTVFLYYSGEYLSILRKWEDYGENPDDMEDFLQDMADYEADMRRMETMKHEYVEIAFDSTGVVSVLYDAARVDADPYAEKAVESVELLSEAASYTYFAVEYTDGSYCMGRAAGAEETWHDAFGNEIDVP